MNRVGLMLTRRGFCSSVVMDSSHSSFSIHPPASSANTLPPSLVRWMRKRYPASWSCETLSSWKGLNMCLLAQGKASSGRGNYRWNLSCWNIRSQSNKQGAFDSQTAPAPYLFSNKVSFIGYRCPPQFLRWRGTKRRMLPTLRNFYFGNMNWVNLAQVLFASQVLYQERVDIKLLLDQRLSWYISVTEGKYRMVRRILHNAGHSVLQLHRTKYGAIVLDDSLEAGQVRRCTDEEGAWGRTLTGSKRWHLCRHYC